MRKRQLVTLGCAALAALVGYAVDRTPDGYGLVEALSGTSSFGNKDPFPFRFVDSAITGGTKGSSSTHAIDRSNPNTWAPECVYQIERYGKDLVATITGLVPSAAYKLELHLTENYFGGSNGAADGTGKRVWKLLINGETVETGIDIYKEAGGAYKALVKTVGRWDFRDGALTTTTNTPVYFGTVDRQLARIVVSNATIGTVETVPNGKATRGLYIGHGSSSDTYNGAQAILEVQDGAVISNMYVVGNGLRAQGAIHQTGGRMVNCGGASNDIRLGNYGYGYLELNGGFHEWMGYGQVGSQGAKSSGVFVQHGGTFRARTDGELFRGDAKHLPDAMTVYAGGAVFDTAGHKATIQAPLVKPTGKGLASITVPTLSDYIGSPVFTITGDGEGATAHAVFDAKSGKVTAVKITSPGTDYTTATVTSTDGGWTNIVASTATLAENVATGGLVKRGEGTLTLLAANTFGGPVTVEAGTLVLKNPAAFPAGNDLVVTGGTLDLNGAVITAGVVRGEGGTITKGRIVCDRFNKEGAGTFTFDAAGVTAGHGHPGLYAGGLRGPPRGRADGKLSALDGSESVHGDYADGLQGADQGWLGRADDGLLLGLHLEHERRGRDLDVRRIVR